MVFVLGVKDNKFIEEVYEKAVKEFEDFFNIKWNYSKPRVFVIDDRETVNQMFDKITPEWLVGWAERKNVYVLDRSAFVKEISNDDYARLIKHELCHCYFVIVSNYCDIPIWLYEGIALYLAGQNERRTKPKMFKDFLNYYDEFDERVYKEAGFAVEFLIKYYGKGKFLELTRGLKYIASKEKFAEHFREVYGFELGYENFKC